MGVVGTLEIPLLLMLFYLFCDVEACLCKFLFQESIYGVSFLWEILSGGESGWGGTFVKLECTLW